MSRMIYSWLLFPLILGLVLAGCGESALSSDSGSSGGGTVVRIGYQKGSSSLLVLKSQGTLEKDLKQLGYTLQWTEFQAGPPLLEALGAGSIDFGATGAPPPIFAQAAGADLVYVAATKPSPKTQAILVPKTSDIKSVADLKGKKVAVQKGSSAHALLVQALEKAGLKYSDIQPVYLAPSDAKAAFEGGSVDAWSIWDPYYAMEVAETGARVIADGESAGLANRSFYLASRKFATEHKDAVDAILKALEGAEGWSEAHRDEVAKLVSSQTGVDEAVQREVEHRRVYGVIPVSDDIVREQQELADLFYSLGLIPKKLNVRDAVLPEYQH